MKALMMKMRLRRRQEIQTLLSAQNLENPFYGL